MHYVLMHKYTNTILCTMIFYVQILSFLLLSSALKAQIESYKYLLTSATIAMGVEWNRLNVKNRLTDTQNEDKTKTENKLCRLCWWCDLFNK